MNKELLLAVKAQILKEPRQFDMGEWFSSEGTYHAYRLKNGERRHREYKIPNCGTTACIWGWGLCLTLKINPSKGAEILRADIIRIDDNIFDLSSVQCDALYYVNYWPQPYRDAYRKATARGWWRKAAKVAADRIDHMIATGN